MLLFTAHWLSRAQLAEHLLSQEYKQLYTDLASQMEWGRVAGVAAGNLQECVTGSERDCLFVSNSPLDLLSCNGQQWPQQRGCDGMRFVGCCNRSASLIARFVITYLCSGFTCIAGSSWVGEPLLLVVFNSRFCSLLAESQGITARNLKEIMEMMLSVSAFKIFTEINKASLPSLVYTVLWSFFAVAC